MLLLQRTEAANVELFYDLFFVANLTVFTNVHEVNDSDTLKQYIGFFSLLWMTWYQVALYDVRFLDDEAIFDSVAKAMQFLVMIGFAVVSPKFNVGQTARSKARLHGEEPEGPNLAYFRGFTLVLVVSRLVLVLQYLRLAFTMRRRKITTFALPLSCTIITYLSAATVYAGLFWTFNNLHSHHHPEHRNHTYIVWYIVAILETLLVTTTIPAIWPCINFEGTHLVQRMNLLTLIILGEGIMSVAKKCQRVVQSAGAMRFTGSTVGDIISAVLILYFMYLTYFAGAATEKCSRLLRGLKQQLWAFLHFPLHLALVLAVEGMAQCIVWRAAVVRANDIVNQYNRWKSLLAIQGGGGQQFDKIAHEVNRTSQTLIYEALVTTSSLDETLEYLTYTFPNALNASRMVLNGPQEPEVASRALDWMYLTLYKTIFNIGGFISPSQKEAPSENLVALSGTAIADFSTAHASEAAAQSIEKTTGVFRLTYVYFFVTIGLVVILFAVMTAISRAGRRPVRAAYVWRLGISGLLGIGLCSLASAEATREGVDFAFSPWVLPSVMLCLLLVLLLNKSDQ